MISSCFENGFITSKNETVSFEPRLSIKREDLIHPKISGNKFRKLKYNFQFAERNKFKTILTFGGAFSNHIAAVAAAGKSQGISTVGIIRGEELSKKNIHLNPTLLFAENCGMHLHFVSRADYNRKDSIEFLKELEQIFDTFYLIPEGGTNELAVKGCMEILNEADAQFDYICAPVGTGGTLAGLINASLPHQKVIGFSALKGNFHRKEIDTYVNNDTYVVMDDYCFNGYAKIDTGLIRFMNEFKQKTDITLDPVYTGKMLFGVLDLIEKEYFKKNSRILAVHTGGLQGIAGMNQKLIKKNLPQIVF